MPKSTSPRQSIKVAQLRDCKLSMWWKEVKKMCGLSPAFQNPDEYTNSLQQIEGVSNKDELANKINETFLLPMNEFQPLSYNLQPEVIELQFKGYHLIRF